MEILKNIINELESGSRPKGGIKNSDGTIPSLGAEHLDDFGTINLDKIKYVSNAFYNSIKSGKIKKNDILVVKDGATTGKVSFIDDQFPYSVAAINEHVFRLSINCNRAESKYIFWYLRTDLGQRQILSDFRGATVGGISRGFIDKVKLPLPPLSEQKRIVEILDKADELRQKRKQAISLIDELLKSVFLDMFGDPVKNDKGWDKISFENCIEYIGDIGSNGSNETVAKNLVMLDEEDYAIMIRTTNLNSNNIEKNLKYVSKKTYDFFSKSKIFGGEIIMNKIGSAGDFWIMPYLNKPVSLGLNQLVIRLKNLNTKFLYYYLSTNYGKAMIKASINGAVTKSITKSAVKALPLLYPSLELQNKFASIVVQIETLKSKMNESLKEMDNQFNALMQKSFSNHTGD